MTVVLLAESTLSLAAFAREFKHLHSRFEPPVASMSSFDLVRRTQPSGPRTMLGSRQVPRPSAQLSRRPRRDPRRDRNRRNLVDSALHVVAVEGAALTVARVARQAGMDPSGFYAHFK